jgi:hypothetical protein
MNTIIRTPVKETQGVRPPNQFARAALSDIISKGNVGYQEAVGSHIYCELRPTNELQFAEDDKTALAYLQIINDLTHYGLLAAAPFNVVLLEAQGKVLHFFKEGPLTTTHVTEALRFDFIFTNVVYEKLKPRMGDKWNGFASCMAHGGAIIVRHGAFSNPSSSSTVSLGPAANEPAKQLLSGVARTPAGCIDVPGEWAPFLSKPKQFTKWLTIPLKDREWMSFAQSHLEDANLRRTFGDLIDRYQSGRAGFTRLNTLSFQQLHHPEGFTVNAPYRLRAFSIKADLDGFSAIVKEAFAKGPDAIDRVAVGFGEIMEFVEYLERTISGCIKLPFAGDCGTLLVPPDATGDFSTLKTTRWLETAIRWQNFAASDSESQKRGWPSIFKNVSWAIGAACGETTTCLLAPIEAENRRFLVGVGWPVATSLEGQNIGKGGEILVHSQDFQHLPENVKKLFAKVTGSEFWKACNLSSDKLRRAIVEGATSCSPKSLVYGVTGTQLPRPRPHLD